MSEIVMMPLAGTWSGTEPNRVPAFAEFKPDSPERLLEGVFQRVLDASSVDRHVSQFALVEEWTYLGLEDVNGVGTTGFSGLVDLSAAALAELDADAGAGMDALVSDGVTQIPVSIWLDSEHRLVRVVKEYTDWTGEVRTDLHLGSFGEQLDISVPAASQIVNG